jgi:hypothetical protein
LTTVAHDDTLTGDGTSGTPLGVTSGLLSSKKIEEGSDCNDMVSQGTFLIQGNCDNTPYGSRNVTMELIVYEMGSDVFQVAYVLRDGYSVIKRMYVRTYGQTNKTWTSWSRLVDSDSLSAIDSRLTTAEAKVQALEAKTTYQPVANGTDLHTLFNASGRYLKGWGTTVVNAPDSITNGKSSKYIVTVVFDGIDGYMRIDPIAGVTDSYYCRKTGDTIRSWYKITATEVAA